MSSAAPPEFFFDRSLGKITARRLREAGYTVHLIAEFYADDASDVADEVWLSEGCSRGWIMLSKDKRIRYRTAELAAMDTGRLFCLTGGNMPLAEMSEAFLSAMPRIIRAADLNKIGFWHVYRDGTIQRKWP